MGDCRPDGLVLIIEDDEAILRVLRDVVVDIIGATALTLVSPDLATDACHPDLIITDLVGSGVHRPSGGRAYLQRIRTRFRATPLMLLTAQQWVRSAAQPLPVDAVVLKPFDLDDLAGRIRALLTASRRPAA